MHPLANVDFRTLQIFLTLMAERGVTATSRVVGVSQPAITQALNRLRKTFGDPLLVRSPQGMQPTERALALEREIRRFLGEVALIQASQQDFDPSRERREVVLTAPEYLEQLLLPAIAMVLRRDAPRVALSIRSPDQRRIDALLAAGDVDFRLGWVRDPLPSVRAMPLFEDDVVVMGGPGNRALAAPLTLAAYVALPHVRLLGSGRTTSGRVIDEFIRQHGQSLAVCIHAQGLMALLGTLMVSDAVATVPRRMALKIQEVFPVRMVDFPGRLPRVSNALYWHERTQRSAFHAWFRGVIGEAARRAAAAYAPLDGPGDPA